MGQMQSYNHIQMGTRHTSPDRSADNKSSGTSHKTKRAFWGDVAGRFCDPRECLASYLALETAEVIAGVKPANLISVPNRTHSCGSNPYTYWKKWGREVTKVAQLESYTLKDRGNSVLVLLYREDVLAELLATPAARAMLRRAGYSGQMGISELLDTLAQRMGSGTFPHEIGIFLGYPLCVIDRSLSGNFDKAGKAEHRIDGEDRPGRSEPFLRDTDLHGRHVAAVQADL